MNRHNARPIEAPQEVIDNITDIRLSGFSNILDRPNVISLARRMGYDRAALWIEANPTLYARAIFLGFTPEPVGFNWDAPQVEEEDHAGLPSKAQLEESGGDS